MHLVCFSKQLFGRSLELFSFLLQFITSVECLIKQIECDDNPLDVGLGLIYVQMETEMEDLIKFSFFESSETINLVLHEAKSDIQKYCVYEGPRSVEAVVWTLQKILVGLVYQMCFAITFCSTSPFLSYCFRQSQHQWCAILPVVLITVVLITNWSRV